MARFEIGTAIVTTNPIIVVDSGLPAGAHLFELIVEDEAGNQSQPDQAIVTVRSRLPPVEGRPNLTVNPPLRPRARGRTRGTPR